MSYTVEPTNPTVAGQIGTRSLSWGVSQTEAAQVSSVSSGTAAVTAVLGIQGGPGTNITAQAANLLVGPRSDITNFTIVSLDAGTY